MRHVLAPSAKPQTLDSPNSLLHCLPPVSLSKTPSVVHCTVPPFRVQTHRLGLSGLLAQRGIVMTRSHRERY